jgi:membrane protein YqaA with SNARE-associated domain
LGYGIGFFAFHSMALPFIETLGYYENYTIVLSWFQRYGFWAVVLAGLTPLPYKLFTICSGAMQFSMGLFLLASLVGRAGRFFLVAALIRWGGEKMEQKLRQIIDRFGWILIGIIGVMLCIYFF